ncbi:hypothetical protein SCP_1501610 [Sparassis crispa]|uniref:Uncharacterized protein n=1 Tax=Sparassis crispa TaxID=139825 RepID=A0A401H412_9APHY|nr:hypothetical protein SCP_1501610 [Sparassis crispa]GBE89154.1 hypothetical protein SCP_1501610 [Sparassis crispa]
MSAYDVPSSPAQSPSPTLSHDMSGFSFPLNGQPNSLPDTSAGSVAPHNTIVNKPSIEMLGRVSFFRHCYIQYKGTKQPSDDTAPTRPSGLHARRGTPPGSALPASPSRTSQSSTRSSEARAMHLLRTHIRPRSTPRRPPRAGLCCASSPSARRCRSCASERTPRAWAQVCGRLRRVSSACAALFDIL